MTRILFATSNGTGLGHLTRCMAIARRLPAAAGSESGPDARAVLMTLSQAMPVAVAEGFHAEFLCSYEYGTMDGHDWNRLFERRLLHLISQYRPDLVVFDGVYPYAGLVAALQRAPEVPFVWSRRAMWQEDVGAQHLRDERLFAAVLEPGEHAAEADRGPTVARRDQAHVVAPIVYLDRHELLTRQEAAQQLGLDPARPAVLVQLGSGSLRSIQSTAGLVISRLHDLGASLGLQVTVAESVIGGRLELPDGVHRARIYPVARHVAAFDLAVAASGYNLFHEALAYGLPTLFVPKRDATRDDQAGRAQWAADHGVGLAWDPDRPDLLDRTLMQLLDGDYRRALRTAMAQLPAASGAADAAGWLLSLAQHQAPGHGRHM